MGRFLRRPTQWDVVPSGDRSTLDGTPSGDEVRTAVTPAGVRWPRRALAEGASKTREAGPVARQAHRVEFGSPPRPQGTFDGEPVGSTLSHAVGAQFDCDPVELLITGSMPAVSSPFDQAGLGQSFEDPRRLLDRPALQLRALHRVQRLVEAPVQVAGLKPQTGPGCEGVVGAGVQSVGEFVDESGAQGRAGAGGARVRL